MAEKRAEVDCAVPFVEYRLLGLKLNYVLPSFAFSRCVEKFKRFNGEQNYLHEFHHVHAFLAWCAERYATFTKRYTSGSCYAACNVSYLQRYCTSTAQTMMRNYKTQSGYDGDDDIDNNNIKSV